MQNCTFFQSISIFQRSLCGGAACFRLKVRGERLKAGSFYRFALNFVYVVARGRDVAIVVIVALAGLVVLGAAKPRGLNDNSSQFYSSIIVNFFPFCGLEECAMHIDNPQMRGLFFCGVTRHVCRGYDRLRILGGPPPNTKLLQGLGELAPSTKPVAGARGIYFIETIEKNDMLIRSSLRSEL